MVGAKRYYADDPRLIQGQDLGSAPMGGILGHLLKLLPHNADCQEIGNVHYIRLCNVKKAEPTLPLEPTGDITRNSKQGYQWPQNRTHENSVTCGTEIYKPIAILATFVTCETAMF